MIMRLECPACMKDSYTAAVESFKPCPYCGVVFSGKYGTEKRYENRVSKEFPVVFLENGQTHQSRILNFSEKGFNIKIFGNLYLQEGALINFYIGDYYGKAHIVWIHNKPNSSIAGLKIVGNNSIFLSNLMQRLSQDVLILKLSKDLSA